MTNTNCSCASNEALKYHSNFNLTNLIPQISHNPVRATTREINHPIQGSISVLYSNVFSLMSKFSELRTLVLHECPDFSVLKESWLEFLTRKYFLIGLWRSEMIKKSEKEEAYLSNLSLESSRLPTDWTIAMNCPIFKNGSSEDPVNYHLVRLASVICKAFETLLNRSIMSH